MSRSACALICEIRQPTRRSLFTVEGVAGLLTGLRLKPDHVLPLDPTRAALETAA